LKIHAKKLRTVTAKFSQTRQDSHPKKEVLTSFFHDSCGSLTTETAVVFIVEDRAHHRVFQPERAGRKH